MWLSLSLSLFPGLGKLGKAARLRLIVLGNEIVDALLSLPFMSMSPVRIRPSAVLASAEPSAALSTAYTRRRV